ncbi:hypothetical protein CEE45_16670 [Candidatus Heimdallarchaeota archaeon B3_Heim]|nr:MAG: hypothetical protein CEE45_16670 [Candidatus Heimdallarchaeota archaeon B3_Heim]
MSISNISLTFSYLHPVWFIISFFGVILIEGGIYYFYFHDALRALKFAAIANTITTFFPLPLLLFPIFSRTDTLMEDGYIVQGGSEMHSLWLIPIIFGFVLLVDLPPAPPYAYNVVTSDYIWTFFIFMMAFVLSAIIEFYFIRIASTPGENEGNLTLSRLKMVLFANLATYILIVGCLISIGFLAAVSGVIDPISELSWLFSTNAGNVGLILLFFVIFLFVFALIVSLMKGFIPVQRLKTGN